MAGPFFVVKWATRRASAAPQAVEALAGYRKAEVIGDGDEAFPVLLLDPRADGFDRVTASIGDDRGQAVVLREALQGSAGREDQARLAELLALELAQGVIGYVQYFTGVPAALVGLHMLGSALVWIATLRVVFALRDRGPLPGRAGTAGSSALAEEAAQPV